jgi:SAM-dependent methyltransferase
MHDVAMSGHDPLLVEAEIAEYYDLEGDARSTRAIDPRRIATRDRFLASLAGHDQARVLDVGSGPGRDSVHLRDAGLDVVAVDLSMGHARRCLSAGVPAVRGSARHLPFADRAFDSVWSMSTLMHVPDSAIHHTLGEVRRVLCAGGIATVGVWGGPDVVEYLEEDRAAGRPRRLFSRRDEETWEQMLRVIGPIESAERWGEGDFFYHLVVVRRD